jgi:hypothetical protein
MSENKTLIGSDDWFWYFLLLPLLARDIGSAGF